MIEITVVYIITVFSGLNLFQSCITGSINYAYLCYILLSFLFFRYYVQHILLKFEMYGRCSDL